MEVSGPSKIEFVCSKCKLTERVDYHGCSPPFSKRTQLKYPAYVMRDPFSPPGSGETLIVGSDCHLCDRSVCISKDCSVFYLKSYCVDCAVKNIELFPQEIRSKIPGGK